MRYQLVLQFAAVSGEDYDRLIDLEETLTQNLGDIANLEGHDFGPEEFNIFFLTDDPITVFAKAHRIVANVGAPNAMRSGYRERDGEEYVVLWPSGLPEFNVS